MKKTVFVLREVAPPQLPAGVWDSVREMAADIHRDRHSLYTQLSKGIGVIHNGRRCKIERLQIEVGKNGD